MQFPEFLQPGDTVTIVGLASKVPKKRIKAASCILEDWGLKVQISKNLFKDHFRFSGKKEDRISDFQEALNDPKTKCILAARGGYGSAGIIDEINWRSFVENPKWIVGFSDITAVLIHCIKLGVGSIHGTMPVIFDKKENKDSLFYLKKMLFGERFEINGSPHQLNRHGKAVAPLIGGNLSILASIIGTASDVDFGNKILFIEEIGEQLYRLDRLMLQLRRAGKLEKLRGIIVGQLTDMKDDADNPFGKSAEEIILSYLDQKGTPIAFGMPVGHEDLNLPVILGKDYQLIVNQDGSFLTF